MTATPTTFSPDAMAGSQRRSWSSVPPRSRARTRISGRVIRLSPRFAATHGAGPAIGRFSIAHHITGSGAWVAALVMMALADVLTRLAVVYLRGRRLAAAPAAAQALIPAGTRA